MEDEHGTRIRKWEVVESDTEAEMLERQMKMQKLQKDVSLFQTFKYSKGTIEGKPTKVYSFLQSSMHTTQRTVENKLGDERLERKRQLHRARQRRYREKKRQNKEQQEAQVRATKSTLVPSGEFFQFKVPKPEERRIANAPATRNSPPLNFPQLPPDVPLTVETQPPTYEIPNLSLPPHGYSSHLQETTEHHSSYLSDPNSLSQVQVRRSPRLARSKNVPSTNTPSNVSIPSIQAPVQSIQCPIPTRLTPLQMDTEEVLRPLNCAQEPTRTPALSPSLPPLRSFHTESHLHVEATRYQQMLPPLSPRIENSCFLPQQQQRSLPSFHSLLAPPLDDVMQDLF